MNGARCPSCRQPFAPGEPLLALARGGWRHAECVVPAPEDAEPPQPAALASPVEAHAGQRYRCRAHAGFRYVTVAQVRSRESNPYAIVRETTASGNRPRGCDRNGIPRAEPFVVALTWRRAGRELLPVLPSWYEPVAVRS